MCSGQALAEFPEDLRPGPDLGGSVIAVDHGDLIAGGRGHDVELIVALFELVFEHHHAEDGRADADVSGARRDRVGGNHAGARVALGWAEDGDRKSTRLNSSHVAISYAVFCLKK